MSQPDIDEYIETLRWLTGRLPSKGSIKSQVKLKEIGPPRSVKVLIPHDYKAFSVMSIEKTRPVFATFCLVKHLYSIWWLKGFLYFKHELQKNKKAIKFVRYVAVVA